MEIIFICIVAFVVWKLWKRNKALNQAALDQAWREVLNDPNWMDRIKKQPPPEPSTNKEWAAYDQRYEELKRKRIERAQERGLGRT